MLLCGLALRLLLAYMSVRLLRTLLYGVTVHDPWTMAAVTLDAFWPVDRRQLIYQRGRAADVAPWRLSAANEG